MSAAGGADDPPQRHEPLSHGLRSVGLDAVAPGYVYQEHRYKLGLPAWDAERVRLLLENHLACAAALGWRPDEPTDLDSLLAAGCVTRSGDGRSATYDTVTVRLRRREA
jgi:hypothetical protein